jgi:hypothetical protein
MLGELILVMHMAQPLPMLIDGNDVKIRVNAEGNIEFCPHLILESSDTKYFCFEAPVGIEQMNKEYQKYLRYNSF